MRKHALGVLTPAPVIIAHLPLMTRYLLDNVTLMAATAATAAAATAAAIAAATAGGSKQAVKHACIHAVKHASYEHT